MLLSKILARTTLGALIALAPHWAQAQTAKAPLERPSPMTVVGGEHRVQDALCKQFSWKHLTDTDSSRSFQRFCDTRSSIKFDEALALLRCNEDYKGDQIKDLGQKKPSGSNAVIRSLNAMEALMRAGFQTISAYDKYRTCVGEAEEIAEKAHDTNFKRNYPNGMKVRIDN